MNFLENLKKNISLELTDPEAPFSYPPNPSLGDLSLACFGLAKTADKNPAEFAADLATKLLQRKKLAGYFSDIKAVGPYINFFIKSEYLAGEVIGEIKKGGRKYGANHSGAARRVMIEYSNGNTHKEYHVGHLRNISYGDAVQRLLKINGFEVIPVSYINDFGIHTAKTLWNWQRNKDYRNSSENKGYLLGQCYAEASQKLEDDPIAKAEVTAIMKNIESRSGEDYDLWQETRQWSIDYYDSIYKELGIEFRKIFYESEEIAAGLALVHDLIDKGILVKSAGAIIANLEKYDLGILPVIRTDGTALYPVADLALASDKFKHYRLDESIYVVDVRQSLYFKQLFKMLEMMGYKQELRHLTYDFVTLPEGMMSSRSGTVISYAELNERLFDRLKSETKQRHEDWTASRVEQVAKTLTVSTIKFEMLKVSPDKTIVFNIEEAAKFDGYTACYLQYGYARLKSIIRKEGFKLFSRRPDWRVLSENKEQELLMQLARYPEIIKNAGAKLSPSEIAKYLFELVQMSNDYYHQTNILKADSPVRTARLALVKAVASILENGFNVLGLPVLEEM